MTRGTTACCLPLSSIYIPNQRRGETATKFSCSLHEDLFGVLPRFAGCCQVVILPWPDSKASMTKPRVHCAVDTLAPKEHISTKYYHHGMVYSNGLSLHPVILNIKQSADKPVSFSSIRLLYDISHISIIRYLVRLLPCPNIHSNWYPVVLLDAFQSLLSCNVPLTEQKTT